MAGRSRSACRSPVFDWRYSFRLCVYACMLGKKQCPRMVPPCLDCRDGECVYEYEAYDSCARYICLKRPVLLSTQQRSHHTGISPKACPKMPPMCRCADKRQCQYQPRTVDACDQYFCRDEDACVPCPAGNNAFDAPCPCPHPSQCLWRERTCTHCGYFECRSSD
jgi:hypothetical protein